MGVQTYTIGDFTTPIAPARLFKAISIDNHVILPKAAPEFVKSVEFVEGDSTIVGCVKQLNCPEGSPFRYVKSRVDEIDFNNLYLKYTSFEGDMLPDYLEYGVYENKYKPSGTGCNYKLIAHFHTKGDYLVKEEDVAIAKESVEKMFKCVEKYLIDNPQVCT